MTRRIGLTAPVTAIAALATLYLLAGTVSPARAAYYPSGPQTFVDQTQLAGWGLCYSGPYSATAQLSGILGFVCAEADPLLLAAGPTGSSTLTVLATAPRADVLFDTGTSNTPHDANGSGWYFSPNYSWGFAKQGDQIERDPCDTVATDVPGPNPDRRLCWPTSGGSLSPGGRAGATFDISDGSYTRYVYRPIPFASAAPATVDFGKVQGGTVSELRPVTVTNRGFLDVELYFAQIEHIDPDEFTLDPNGCLTTISPGEACQMWVRFAPLLVPADDPCRSNLWAYPEACDRGPGTTLSIEGTMGNLHVALRGLGTLPPSGQQAAALAECKKKHMKAVKKKRANDALTNSVKKKFNTKLKKCKKKAKKLPV
jgi:hypothetical protein